MLRWLTILTLALAGCARREAGPLTVSVAASLRPAMSAVMAHYSGGKVDFNYGGSGALARQIASGAPVDIFVAAGPKPMDDLSAKALLLPGTRRDLLRNTVVLIASSPAVTSWNSLADAAVRQIALGDPESAPAGDYGRQVLRSLGLWDRVQPKLIFDQDVRQVLSHVATGNADAGIVYATDAKSEPHVRAVADAPPNTHDPVVYPIAILKSARDEHAARALAAFLAGPEACAIFESFGFRAAR
jgi:molybdate transport system substrate-binding protein